MTKRFGKIVANDDVTFSVMPGEVVALLGENGAGKSTAMNVLCGLYLPDAGTVEVDERPLVLGSPAASVARGIGMVHQQFKLVLSLTAYENVSLAVDRGRFWQRKRPSGEIERLMAEVGFELDMAKPVWRMSLAERQQLEILRVLAQGARILVLDEPTSVLSPLESERLFMLVRRIIARDRAVILISHKLSEIRQVASRLVVMRGGRVVFEGPASGRTSEEIAGLIVGTRSVCVSPRPSSAKGPDRLTVENLRVKGHSGRDSVRDVSFRVQGGELVAVVGVAGNGQAELLDAIGGQKAPSGGRIVTSDGRKGRRFAFVPAQHLGVALAPGLSIEDNTLLGVHRRRPFSAWMARRDVRRHCRTVQDMFGVAAEPGSPIRRLSGGNLQRIVLGRELVGDPALVVASYPTRGLDIAAAAQIRNALIARAAAGAAVLMASEELEECLTIATRILVMSGGRVVLDRETGQTNLDEIGRFMTAAEAS
ncbi:ABC transporter ATP-binding protein [Methylobacterium terricola]|uniref:ABC transporter ATP-binding protein n=1 Tax=Methylobacterium terricola TaxID=2583531 RepID=UPI001485D3B5|nr:ATP-binding cassette domain-containing protein [Methylobacterium terricola]